MDKSKISGGESKEAHNQKVISVPNQKIQKKGQSSTVLTPFSNIPANQSVSESHRNLDLEKVVTHNDSLAILHRASQN